MAIVKTYTLSRFETIFEENHDLFFRIPAYHKIKRKSIVELKAIRLQRVPIATKGGSTDTH